MLLDSGEQLSLFSNPNATSVFQFYDTGVSLNLDVHRKGRVFFFDFDAPSDGFVLFKFSYYPLASVLDNGKSVEVKEEENGLIIAPIKTGASENRVLLQEYEQLLLCFAPVPFHRNLTLCGPKKLILRSHFEK